MIGPWLSAALARFRDRVLGTVPLTPIDSPELEPDPDPLVAAGEAALAEAERLWALDIHDPSPTDKTANAARCRALIHDMIASPQGLALTRSVYRGNGLGVEWCVGFWLRCWGAGLAFTLLQRQTFWASTYRVMELFRRRGPKDPAGIFGVPAPVRPGRQRWTFDATTTELPAGCVPRAGDLLMVGDGTPPWGDHATMVVGYDAARREFHTIEGNATGGVGPTGKRRQGVIKAKRPLGRRAGHGYFALVLYRPSPADLTALPF